MRIRIPLLLLLLGALFALPAPAGAAVTCPNPNPVVNENNCMGAGSTAWQLNNYDQGGITGYATKSSVNFGESVPLRIALASGSGSAEVNVFRMGWYGGAGGRLVYQAKKVTVNNDRYCESPDTTTGYWSCENWENTLTIPGSSLPASGVYIARIKDLATSQDNQILFVVRNDSWKSALLYKLPTATYQAYNNFNGHSLYRFNSAGFETITGTSRAVKVSFDRPYVNSYDEANWFFKADFPMVEWMERQGYEVDYTDSVSVSENPGQLLNHKTLVISGHDEYWSGAEMAGYKAAREAGVNLASFSGNTAYWRVRYEDNFRTLVCYKAVEGTSPSGTPEGQKGVNDWGPDGIKGTKDDVLGLDGKAGTADDNPQYATTTFRDDGAPPGSPNAPAGGRVGPNEPENSLLGSMYVGDNDNYDYPLTIPAANTQGEYGGDRIWRNTGISSSSTTTIGTNLNGWEWDSIPTQAQYLAKQPAGVTRVSLSDLGKAPSPPEWIQDEGLLYSTTPPPGQPTTVSAVKYTAPSGAFIFSAGTIQWSWGLAPHLLNKPSENFEDPAVDSSDPRIQQATYNIFADGGVQPQTPTGIVIDGNTPPKAAFTATPNPTSTGSTVTFNASGSSDTDGTVTRYEWDLDGNGTFETDTGTTPTATKSYANAEEVTVRLRITDNGGASDQTSRVVVVSSGTPGNIAPKAAFTISPNPASKDTLVTFDGSGSSDSDGTIAKYEWDLDGNGTYETSTGSSPTATRSYSSEGDLTIRLRVTDNSGGTATINHVLIVGHGSTYRAEVLGTPGLRDYWRFGEQSGSSLADAVGGHTATAQNGFALGASGAIDSDLDTAISFDGSTGAASAPLDFSGTSQLTVEFWLNWAAYANDDDLAMEFTPNFNNTKGGFLVDPNAGEMGGKFGVGIGSGEARNNVYFARPSAGSWHHYAFVFNTTAAAAQQIVPYVDGQPISFEKLNSGTGAGPFANSTLYLMSRAAGALFGKGNLDELSIYDRALSGTEISAHYQSARSNKFPNATFTASPNPVPTNTQVTLDATGSSDPDGTIVKYEWDLDGNGTYETDTGPSAQTTASYTTEGVRQLGLRVTDNSGAVATATRTLTVENHSPQASFTATPNPVAANATVSLDASASTDPDGTIAKYEWDLDGNGTYETNTGSVPQTTTSFSTSGDHQVGLRVTDGEGTTATAVRTVTVGGAYSSAVGATAGLTHYWRLGDPSGKTFADVVGNSTAAITGGVTLGAPGALEFDSNPAAGFDGASGAASAPVDLSGSSQLTVEFWLNWAAYANDDDLAMELTPNFNNNGGGFLVDPNAAEQGGKFGVAIGRGESRNNVYFARPSAGTWHHYAFVFDTTAAGSQQIVPYVDGQPVPYEKTISGTGAGPFANSTLYLMSRAATALFGKGSLDEVALYNKALTPAQVNSHYLARGGNKAPQASFTATPNPVETNKTVNFDASASKDVDGTIAKYEWDLDGNGTYETDTGATPTVSKSYDTPGHYNVGLRVTDNGGVVGTNSVDVAVTNQPPTASFTATPNPAPIGTQVSLNASASSDPDGSIVKYEWDLDGNGTYETNTGTTPAVNTRFTRNGEATVRLRVVDNSGEIATASRIVTVVGSYYGAVSGTSGLTDYWRLGETTANTFADGVGGRTATAQGNVGYGVPGALAADPNKAASFDGSSAAATAPLNLSGTSQLTVEFWLNWAAYANNDRLAMEFTPNFNETNGGFLVDPNAGELGGKFGVGIGRGTSRNNAYFTRPSAGSWHHYTFVLDSTAAASQQVIPYVDGQPIAYQKTASGTGAGNFANSNLYLMSRAAAGLFGKGSLDELAIYSRALNATEVAAHYDANINKAPVAAFATNPNPVAAGIQTSFDANASTDPDGAVVKYEWDLDGNGSYETDTGSTPTASTSFAEAGDHQVGLRVTDDGGATATTTRTVAVFGTLPTAAFTATPNPVTTGDQVSFDASSSSDPEGPIAHYEWDLDGNGSYETDTGSTATTSRSYSQKGTVPVGLRVTDSDGARTTTVVNVTAQNRAPSASFTVSPNPVSTLAQVSLDGSGSSDSDGKVVKYEWDLDGNGSYETDTGSTATVSTSFPSAANRELGLRVTDDDGATGTTTRTLTVQNQLPTASFTATPNPVLSGTDVTFDASGSADPDGTIAKYEWDLDGNGSYETDTGSTASATTSFATAGSPTVGLRVTDSDGDTATTTRTVTVQNRPPAASFTATPNPVPTGTAVSFDASGSTDPDGTIAKYEWDLDGNGTYETDTGATATASRTYATASTPTIGLRVTDNNGGTATTTRVLTVQNRPPTASFTATPNPVTSGQSVTLNASGSTDPDGTVAKYEWDYDGNGTYDATTTSASTSKVFSTAGNFNVGLRVTDNNGATATTSKALTVSNRAPTSSFTATPNPVPTGTNVTFNGAASSDPDGTVAKYEWDLDGNGTYETDTGATASTSKSFATAGTVTIGLRVTDNLGATATSSKSLTVQNRAPVASFTATPNPVPTGTAVSFDASASSDPDGTVSKYEWDLDGNGSYETNTGATATTSKTYATASTPTIRLRVTDNAGAQGTATTVLTVQNRLPTASFTATPNPVTSGQSVTLNASGSTDPDGTIAKYEWDYDGNGTYDASTTNASTTRTFSTAGNFNVGLRVTDNNGGTATTSKALTVSNRAPTASFTTTPNPVPTGTAVALNGSGSTDPDGTIAKYEWDLDGNGTYETDTGATATTSKTFNTVGSATVGLRVTDNLGLTATTSKVITVQNRAPVASFTITPNPLTVGGTASFNGSASTDPDGTVAKYEWDLDGNGTYETSTGGTATTSNTFATSGNRTIGLRVTDNLGATGTSSVVLNVQSNYSGTIAGTSGLADYWRLGETSGTSLADGVGGRTATTAGSPTLGVAGALPDSSTAVSFDGSNDSASAALNLSGTSAITVEFWMKWNSFGLNDDMAMEFTSNSGNNAGGFFIQPNAFEQLTRFGVGIGRSTSRNSAFFARPSAGVWHHYAFVLNSGAAAAQQVIPYVDGAAVSYTKPQSGTGAGNFANSTLYFMSRGGSSLFGGGSLDEVAIYNRALTAAEVSAHFKSATP
ncbi:MAG: PKD domain-containing protein [Solirubrobacterales bacterium]